MTCWGAASARAFRMCVSVYICVCVWVCNDDHVKGARWQKDKKSLATEEDSSPPTGTNSGNPFFFNLVLVIITINY